MCLGGTIVARSWCGVWHLLVSPCLAWLVLVMHVGSLIISCIYGLFMWLSVPFIMHLPVSVFLMCRMLTLSWSHLVYLWCQFSCCVLYVDTVLVTFGESVMSVFLLCRICWHWVGHIWWICDLILIVCVGDLLWLLFCHNWAFLQFDCCTWALGLHARFVSSGCSYY